MRFHPGQLNAPALAPDAVDRAADLAGAARAGDREAFDRLIDLYTPRLFRFLRMRAGSHGLAEELVQDTFVQCWRTLDRFDPTRSFSTWIYKLASNLAVSRARQARARPETELDGSTPCLAPGSDPAHIACARDACSNIWDTVHHALPPEARTSLWLFYSENRSAAEIGEILGKSDGAVRVLLLRARSRLATILKPDAMSMETR